jgi:hypothetical protein
VPDLLKGKRALVTGGSRGLGRALCTVFAEHGADVAFNYSGDQEGADATLKSIRGRGLAFKASVLDEAALNAMVKDIERDWGGIDILVNCLAEQLRWAEDSAGHPGRPTVSLYVNTANPGAAGSWWPEEDEYPAGREVHNPYGPCEDGDFGKACAYMYGFAKAYDDAHHRGVSNPGSYFWWLDVETENSWSGTDKEANRAVLEGMTDFFHSIGAQVGIYSTGRQWDQIVGPVSSSSNLYALPSWLAGSRSASGAALACADAPLTGGGTVALTQFVSRGFDYNHSCP